MNRSFAPLELFLTAALVLALPSVGPAEQGKPIQLPPPRTEGGAPLMKAFKERKSTRSFSSKELPLQLLSDLLWAAFGVNRPESGGRTAPSAHGVQDVDVYVAKADGLFLYDAKGDALVPISPKDVRALTGVQGFVKDAPVDLVYVSDLSKLPGSAPEEAQTYAAEDAGFIGQNVYLFCASEGLATVVRGSIDRAALGKALGLRAGQKIILAQTVGYPL